MTEKELEEYYKIVSTDINVVDYLPDEIKDELIKYLESKVKDKEEILSSLEE